MEGVVIRPAAQQGKKQHQRKYTRYDRRNARPPDAQLGKAPVTENESVIQDQVHKSGRHIDPQHGPGLSPAAEKSGQGIGCGIGTAAQTQDLKVGHLVLLNQRTMSNQPENRLGKRNGAHDDKPSQQ